MTDLKGKMRAKESVLDVQVIVLSLLSSICQYQTILSDLFVLTNYLLKSKPHGKYSGKTTPSSP